MNIINYILLITFFFIVYIEFSIGNILFRTNSIGNKSLNIPSLINFLIHPLKNSFLWNFKALDINYPFVLIVSIILYYASDFKDFFIFKK
jgi:hypothetical protein